MHFLGVLIIGLLIGVIAKFLMPGRDPGGCIITMLLGVAGAAFGTYLGHLLGFYEIGQQAGFIGSVIGAMIILLIYRMIMGKRP
ncbi:MAG: GlsB/YeaQ/YmgE family stress response membrane protein [Chthoniobacter sp.]|uniref:GlsB/YeaQ/YmgE family stress response membrane protein n=1 Tax=Chthoniobacter sp. TaxID=2510640 RepID=UPI0032A35F02